MKPLAILFAGQESLATLVDGSPVQVYIRAMPQRWLARVIECAEYPASLVELCCYIKAAAPAGTGALAVVEGAAPAYPDIPAPAGYEPVPQGWSDNLSDESVAALYELAKALNFQRAVDWAAGQIAAKKLVAPLHEMSLNQVMPVVLRVMEPLMRKLDALSNSTPSAPSSAATPASSS